MLVQRQPDMDGKSVMEDMLKKLARNVTAAAEAERVYRRAEKEWKLEHLPSAFRLFLSAAEAGYIPAFALVGQFYDFGTGVTANEAAALYWYRRAFRYEMSSFAAANLGCIWRDRGNLKRALFWFERTLARGDGDAYLDIGKMYIQNWPNPEKATHYLRATLSADNVSDDCRKEARLLLKRLKNEQPTNSTTSGSKKGQGKRVG